MKKILYSLALLIVTLSTTSCSDNDKEVYVSTSGEGSIIVDYDYPAYLYRMIIINNEELQQQTIYLMGNSAYINADAEFKGRGAVAKLTIPNSEDNTTLAAQSFEINQTDYLVSYSRYINYSAAESEDEFAELNTGTVLIRKSGQFYDIRLLGSTDDDDNIIITYRGYIYRTIFEDVDESLRD